MNLKLINSSTLIRKVSFVLLLIMLAFSAMAQQTLSPDIDSVVVVFETIPTQVNVEKAPLKYNKAFAMSFQEDDALSEVYDQVFPVFQGTNGNSGLYFSDGCGNLKTFKMSSAIYIFTATGQDLLDPNDPWHDNSKLVWPKLIDMYRHHWGIENHGLFDNPNVSSSQIINYAFTRTQSYASRKISDSINFKSFVIPNNVTNFINNLSANHYGGAINQGQDSRWIGYHSPYGFNVESDTINWLKPVLLNRLFWYDNFVPLADSLYAASQRGEHRWLLSGMHQVPGTFISDMKTIDQKYGAEGLDDILVTTDDELLDYLAVKQTTQIHRNLDRNKLVITFSGDIPTNRTYYSLSLNVNSDAKIQSIQIYGGKQNSYKGIGNDTALINLSWYGRVYRSVEALADSFTQLAVDNNSQWDALVAMDYVLQVKPGDHKIKLQQSLCSLDRSGWTYQYEDGFCSLVDLGPDTTICAGDSVTLRGPDGMSFYQWHTVSVSNLGNNDSLVVKPMEATQYYLTVTDSKGKSETDSVTVFVLPSPNINLISDTILLSLDPIKLQVDSITGYSYQWNTEDTTSSVLLYPDWNKTYKYNLMVTSSNGCSAKDSVQIIVPPQDSVPVVTVLSDTVFSCGESQVTVETTTNTHQLVWNSLNYLDTTQVSALSLIPQQSGYIYVKGINTYGSSLPDSVYVQLLKSPSFSVNNDTSICFGDSLNLNVSGADHVKWFSNGQLFSEKDTVNVYLEKDTIFNIQVWNDLKCVAKDSVRVFVNSLPETHINMDTNVICKGSVAVLSAEGASNYFWSSGNHQTSDENQVVVNDTMKVLLTGINEKGCSRKDSVVLYPLPLPQTKIVYQKNNICKGSEVSLQAQGAENYLWSPLDDTTKQVSFLVQDTIEIKLEGINEYGCTKTDSVTIYSLPVPETKIVYDTNKICQGLEISLKADGANYYHWFPGDDTLDYYDLTVKDTVQITLLGTNDFGCESIDSLTVYSLPVPDVSFSGLLSYYCSNDVSATLSGLPSGGIFSGDGIVDGVFFPEKAGEGNHEIKYIYKTDEGCLPQKVKVTTVSPPVPEIHLTPQDTTLDLGEHVTYDAGAGFDHYFWTTGDTTRVINIFYQNQMAGVDTIHVAGIVNSCVSFGEAVLYFGQITDIINYTVEMVSAYPNPNSGKFFVKLGTIDKPFSIRVLEASGKLIYQENHQAIPSSGELKFDLHQLHSGIYFVCICAGKQTAFSKIIIQ
ncbi:MAG: T9SS type A sorting domain-containing protein [Bacteroidales bacterium]|nr:T9SS type A sorting domain-containing protein [Bacteroidales bacterium]